MREWVSCFVSLAVGIALGTVIWLSIRHWFSAEIWQPFSFGIGYVSAFLLWMWADHLFCWMTRPRSSVKGTVGSPTAERAAD